jgi:acetyl-CoA acyltransferase
MPLYLGQAVVDRDTNVRADSNLSAYSRLRPVFDPRYGTITAGNSSPLTDGAAAVLLMSDELARSVGAQVLATVRGHAFVGLDPADQLLLGAAYAIPKALARTKTRWKDLDLVDLHEAFAAQVLSTTQALESDSFARNQLGQSKVVGTVDTSRCNVLGGSIAIGHPFAATGVRQVIQTAHELRRRGGELALCATCAAGGQGAAIILEVA